ncbi:MAG: hypothetical protein JWR74_2085 [Polaromonas sp.]|jgi:hypothetical protein|nr:hypothetical protein [Polaromonas sp.]
MLLAIKFAAAVGLVASSASWVALQQNTAPGQALHPDAQDASSARHEPNKAGNYPGHQMPVNVCSNGCSFASLVSLVH